MTTNHQRGRRVVVAGGRSYPDRDRLREILSARFQPGDILVSGACSTGADKMAEEWARDHGVPVERHPADWNAHGSAAGPIRNRQMAEAAGLLIAFPGGRGTANMIEEARKRGVEVEVVGYD